MRSNNGPSFTKSPKKKPFDREYPDGREDEFFHEYRYGQPDEPKWNPRKETWAAYKRRMNRRS